MKISKKLAAFTVAGAVIVSLVGVSQAAQAALIPSSTITITPVTGSATADPFLSTLTTNAACPAGSVASVTSVYQGGVRLGNVSNVRTTTTPNTGNTYGEFGFGSAPISLNRIQSSTNDFLTNKTLSAVPGITDGQFELRVFCFTSTTTFDYANAPFFALPMQLAAGVWSLYTAPVAAIATTTSLTASAAASTVTLTATVKKPDTTTATDAVGNVVFREGATTVATVPVASGVAVASLPGIADGPHTYTAEFVPTDAVYAGSTSGGALVQVGAIIGTSTIIVTIPNNVGALTLTGVSTSVNLGTAVLGGGTLNASGTLNAVVTDTRQLDYPGWNLTGQVGNFTDGAKVLDGKFLGWTPAVSGTAGSVAGAAVLPSPATVNGIKAISTMATGAPSNSGTVTNASALLELKAPSNTPQGTYSATLTLTLI